MIDYEQHRRDENEEGEGGKKGGEHGGGIAGEGGAVLKDNSIAAASRETWIDERSLAEDFSCRQADRKIGSKKSIVGLLNFCWRKYEHQASSTNDGMSH